MAVVDGQVVDVAEGGALGARLDAAEPRLRSFAYEGGAMAMALLWVVIPADFYKSDPAESKLFLLEAERGCSRTCTYCVMRRSTNGGMRIVPKERVLDLIPQDARRVGLVGADAVKNPRGIPASAHGTNAASAVMAGMKVVVVQTGEDGSLDMTDLVAKIEQHRD